MEKSMSCDSFELIDEDEIEQATAERQLAELEAPWIRPEHPLYFADTQSSLADRSTDLEAFALERWYTALAEHTFKTVWVSMTADEIRAVYYTNTTSSSPEEVTAALSLLGKDGLSRSGERRDDNAALTATSTSAPSGCERKSNVVEGLIRRIDEAIRANFGGNETVSDGERIGEGGGVGQQQPPSVFLRLSTRSPKDSTALEGSAVSCMASDRTYWPPTSDSDNDNEDSDNEDDNRGDGDESAQSLKQKRRRQMWRENRKLASYTAAMLQGLKVSDGATAVKVIAGSHKAACDMEALLSKANQATESHTAGETNVTANRVGVTCIILREWVDMQIDHEFRVFVARCSEPAVKGENRHCVGGDAKTVGAKVVSEGCVGGDKAQLEKLSYSAAEPSKYAVTGITQYFHYLNFDFLEDGISHWSAEERREIGQVMSDFVLTNIVPHANTYLPSRRPMTTAMGQSNPLSEKQGSPYHTCASFSSSWSEFIVDLALIPVPIVRNTSFSGDTCSIRRGGGENGVEGEKSEEANTNGHGNDEIQNTKVKKGGKSGDLLQIRGIWYRLVIIELNPFAPAATGGMLFDWKKDLHILWPRPTIIEAAPEHSAMNSVHVQHQTSPPVFRIRDELRENFDNISLLPWGYEETIRQANVVRKGGCC